MGPKELTYVRWVRAMRLAEVVRMIILRDPDGAFYAAASLASWCNRYAAELSRTDPV